MGLEYRIADVGAGLPAGEDLLSSSVDYAGYCMAIVSSEIVRSAQSATAMLGWLGILVTGTEDTFFPRVAGPGSIVPAVVKGTDIVPGMFLAVDITNAAGNRAKLYKAVDGGTVCARSLGTSGTDNGVVTVELWVPVVVADVSLQGVGN